MPRLAREIRTTEENITGAIEVVVEIVVDEELVELEG